MKKQCCAMQGGSIGNNSMQPGFIAHVMKTCWRSHHAKACLLKSLNRAWVKVDATNIKRSLFLRWE